MRFAEQECIELAQQFIETESGKRDDSKRPQLKAALPWSGYAGSNHSSPSPVRSVSSMSAFSASRRQAAAISNRAAECSGSFFAICSHCSANATNSCALRMTPASRSDFRGSGIKRFSLGQSSIAGTDKSWGCSRPNFRLDTTPILSRIFQSPSCSHPGPSRIKAGGPFLVLGLVIGLVQAMAHFLTHFEIQHLLSRN